MIRIGQERNLGMEFASFNSLLITEDITLLNQARELMYTGSIMCSPKLEWNLGDNGVRMIWHSDVLGNERIRQVFGVPILGGYEEIIARMDKVLETNEGLRLMSAMTGLNPSRRELADHLEDFSQLPIEQQWLLTPNRKLRSFSSDFLKLRYLLSNLVIDCEGDRRNRTGQFVYEDRNPKNKPCNPKRVRYCHE